MCNYSIFFLDLEWKIIYVGSAESEEYDQILDSVLVGPVPAGRHMFVFQVCLFSENVKIEKNTRKVTVYLSYVTHTPFEVLMLLFFLLSG